MIALESVIRSQQNPNCYLCGASGSVLYKSLKDMKYHTPGLWDIYQCSDPNCKLIWLNPLPIEEDIWKAYQTYYTHINGNLINNKYRSGFKLIYHYLHQGILKITHLDKERKILELMYLLHTKPGRLLEIGCGNGHSLSKLRSLGWAVVGQEIDPKAARIAQTTYGLTVNLGNLEDCAFPDQSFDAIIMRHVIEHVFNPIGLLAECYRILRSGGLIIIVTPNIDSIGHKHYKCFWRGLEPPRHLHLFSNNTLNILSKRAGFKCCETWTSAAHAEEIFLESLLLIKYFNSKTLPHPTLSDKINALFNQLLAKAIFFENKSSGEECIMRLVK